MQTIAAPTGSSTPIPVPPSAPIAREAFLAALANLDPTQNRTGPKVHFAAGDLAKLVGCSPCDVLDMTAHLADHWWHHDEPKVWYRRSDVDRFVSRCCHGNHAADVMIAFVADGHAEALAEAFYGEAS